MSVNDLAVSPRGFELRDEVVVRTEPFELATPRGTLRGLAQSNQMADGASRGTVVVAPPFGVPMRRGQGLALYLLFNGFDVVRYDPTNHVGVSDGDILDLTSTALVDDLDRVLQWSEGRAGRGRVSLFASSISARLAFRALAERDRGLNAVGTISAAIDMRAAITAAMEGDDLVGRWLAGKIAGPDETELVLDNVIKWRFIEDLVQRAWDTAESTADDLSEMSPVPMINVYGAKDDWVDVEQARAILSAREQISLVVLSDAVHALNPASARIAMTEVVRFFIDPHERHEGPVAVPEITQIVQQRKSEGLLEQRGELPPFVEVMHNGLLKSAGGGHDPASES